MRRSLACVFAAGALVVFPAILPARQSAVPPQADLSRHTRIEADQKYKQILSLADGVVQIDKIVPALEQFIRDYPNYPQLHAVYANLIEFASIATIHLDTVVAFADEAMAKYPDLRRAAMGAKVRALHAQKKDDEVKALAAKALETETDPAVLQTIALADRDDGVKLLEKAIDERKKRPAGFPALEDLIWSYAQTLIRAGRTKEGVELARQALDPAAEEIAALERLPDDDPKRSSLSGLRGSLGDRYYRLANLFDEIGDYENGLDYLARAERAAGNRFEHAPLYDARARVYAKMGKVDLALESYARAFASSMDPGTRDKIVEFSAKNGRRPEEVYARARRIRSENARAIEPFTLRAIDGRIVALRSLKAKAIVVNFFHPT